jgi:hypothetical protein
MRSPAGWPLRSADLQSGCAMWAGRLRSASGASRMSDNRATGRLWFHTWPHSRHSSQRDFSVSPTWAMSRVVQCGQARTGVWAEWVSRI